MPQTLGVIGGRPNHALFFIGYVDEELLHLDPHTTQDSVKVGSKDNDEEIHADGTYHLEKVGRLKFEELDPSLALVSALNSNLLKCQMSWSSFKQGVDLVFAAINVARGTDDTIAVGLDAKARTSSRKSSAIQNVAICLLESTVMERPAQLNRIKPHSQIGLQFGLKLNSGLWSLSLDFSD